MSSCEGGIQAVSTRKRLVTSKRQPVPASVTFPSMPASVKTSIDSLSITSIKPDADMMTSAMDEG
jgi:hypothetical protein